jgi:hypothetical protein
MPSFASCGGGCDEVPCAHFFACVTTETSAVSFHVIAAKVPSTDVTCELLRVKDMVELGVRQLAVVATSLTVSF